VTPLGRGSGDRRGGSGPIDSPFAPTQFEPAWWLPGPHAQTLGARYLRRKRGVPLVRERIGTPDGDFLDLDWVGQIGGEPADAPLVLVLHGLEGSARSGYAVELYRQLGRHKLAAVGLNFRSCSGELNRAPRLYHSGETGDLAFVLGVLGGRFPGRPLAAAGFSLGGNVLVKYLGEEGSSTPLAAAAAVSVPFDLAAGADHLESGFGRLYVDALLRSLRAKVRVRAAEFDGRMDLARALAARTFREFDDAATAPLHGFAGADDYYRRSSSGALVGRVRVPTVLVQALDDPFLPGEAVPRADIAANPMLTDAVVAHGGHVGFASGPVPLRPRLWAESEAARFLREVLDRCR
jgi:uncharacterized protein